MSKSDSSSVTKNKLTPGAGHRDDRATTPGTDDESTVGPICENFAPQTWRKTICRNCFHAKSEHGLDTRTNGTENLANSADARKTTSKKEEEKEKSSDKNVSSTTDKSKNTAQTAPEATVKEEETKNTKPLAALLESNKPKKSPHVIPNATPVSLIMSNLANSKKPSPVDVKKCGPPGNTLLSTASAKKLVEKFGGSKTAPPSPSGPGPNKLPTFGKKTNSFLKETSKTDAPSPGTKQVTSAEASAKSSKTSDVVSTSAGTTSTPSSSLSSTSSSQSTSKTTSAASSKDTTTTKDSTIDTKKGSSDSSSTATSTTKTATAPSTSSSTTTTKPTTTTTTTTTTKPSTTTSDSANDKSKISSASTTPTSTKTSTGDTSKTTSSAKVDTATASTVPPSSAAASKGQVGSSTSTSTTSTPAIKTPVVTVAASDDKNAASEKTPSKAKTRSPSPSFLSSSSSSTPASPTPPSPAASTSLAAPSLSPSTKSTTKTTTTTTTTTAAATTTTPSTTTKPSLSMPPPSPSSPSTPLSPSSPVSPSPKSTTSTHAKPTSTPPATSVQQAKSTTAPTTATATTTTTTTTTQKGVSPTASKSTTTTATTSITASDKTTTTAVTTTKTTPTAKTTTTSSVPSSTPAISTKPTTYAGGTTTTTTTTNATKTTKTAATAPTSLGAKFTGQLTDTPAPTSPIPKVKTMVVESSKYAKSQAEAAAAAAAAEAAATAAALAVAATTTIPTSTPISTPTPATSPSTTTQSTKEETANYGDYGDNMASIRRTGRYTDDPHVGSTRAFTSATSDEVKNDGQRCMRSHSFEGSNVIITSGQDNEGIRDSPGRLSRQDSTSSTSSSSESGRSRQPIVVEVQVRKGHRSSQQASQPTGRSPSPAPFVVISPGGATRVGRTPITTTIRTGFGFPSGRMSPSVLHSGFSGLGGFIDSGGGDRSWDSGGGSFVSSPSPSSCSSPVPSSMRSGYRPYQSPSPSPSPSTPARVIPLPVLHTTSTGVSPDSYEFNVARATSPHIAGYHTPPPPPYTPPLDTPTTPSRTSSTSPSQQFYSPGPSSIQDGKASGSHYVKDVDYDLDTRFDPNNFENKPRYEGGKSRDVLVIDNRITRDKDNQQAQPNTYVQQVSGYSPSISQQQAENASVICHHRETNIDASQPAATAAAAAAAAATAAAVSRYPGKDNITQASSTDAVVSPSSPAASTAVAAPPASISNEGRQEAHSLKAVPCENRDQGPKKSYHETPDDQSKSKGGQSRSPAEISPSETNRGLSFEEVEKIKSKVAELEECIQKLKDDNSKLQNDLNEKSIIEKQVAEYTEKLQTMEKKCTDLEEDKKELEDQVQIEKMKVAKGQLESRSLAELRKLLEESDQTRMRLNEENNTLREEVNEMKLEVDEMYDQFRESDAEDFRELQKELEITAKNCRILQFKLRKAERRNDQIETEREHYEDKLRNLQDAFENQDARRHIQALEEELKMAKEVSVRLHDELDIVEEKRSRVEDDNRKLQDMLELSDKKNFRMEMEIDKLRDKVADLQSAMAKVANCTQDTSPNRKRYQY